MSQSPSASTRSCSRVRGIAGRAARDAQGLGAAVGNIICPHNIVAGAATVGLAGREAEVLRRTLVPCLVVLVLGGVLVSVLLMF